MLLNPVPHPKSTTTTERNVAVAAAVTSFDTFKISNLNSTPTRDYLTLVRSASASTWLASRPQLLADLGEADVVLFAWGVSAAASPNQHLRQQVRWVINASRDLGHPMALMVDAQPRHPSRWRQYLGPVHGRHADGVTFPDRLRLALQFAPADTPLRT